MADYLPGPDADYQAWVANFVTYASANMAALGLALGDLTAITSAQSKFNLDFAAHIAARQAAQGAKQLKDEDRSALTAAIRPLVRRLQATSVVSDSERAALGINVAAAPSPIGPPTTRPLVSVEGGQRLQHTLRYVDEASPTRRAKPAGVMGVEIWNKVGVAPPVGDEELKFVAVDTNAPFVLNFDSADGGKNAYYWLRWVSPTGERGPWSEQAAATVAA